jgi:hypothetical protein
MADHHRYVAHLGHAVDRAKSLCLSQCFLLQPGVFRPRPVRLGLSALAAIEILHGFSA